MPRLTPTQIALIRAYYRPGVPGHGLAATATATGLSETTIRWVVQEERMAAKRAARVLRRQIAQRQGG